MLYRRGMSVVYTMCDMASSDYLRLLYGEKAADMLDKTQEDGTTLRGQMDAAHYKTADAVFLLDATVPTSDGTTDGLSEELQELYRIQSAVGLSGYLSLNAGADSDRISLSAMLTATELFTCCTSCRQPCRPTSSYTAMPLPPTGWRCCGWRLPVWTG